MADRGASVAVVAQIGAASNKPIHLYEAYFDSGTVYATDAAFPIVFNGNTYLANGEFLGFDGLSESIEMQSSTIRVQLSGVDGTYVAAALTEDYIDRRMVIRKGFLNTTTGALLVDPFAIFDGKMDAPVINEDPVAGTCTVTVTASNQWVDFERKAGRHTNDQEQQIHAPGDRFFEFVSEVARTITWGGAPVAVAPVSPNAGGHWETIGGGDGGSLVWVAGAGSNPGPVPESDNYGFA